MNTGASQGRLAIEGWTAGRLAESVGANLADIEGVLAVGVAAGSIVRLESAGVVLYAAGCLVSESDAQR